MTDKRQWYYKPNPQDRLTKEEEAENERLIQEREQKQKEEQCPTKSK